MNCCNDVVSCAGAVASGGVTCAIEAARDAIRAAIAGIEKLRDERQVEFDAVLAGLRRETEGRLQHWTEVGARATRDLDAYADEAARLVAGDVDRLRAAVSGVTRNAALAAGTAATGRAEITAQVAVLAAGASSSNRMLAEQRALLVDDSLSEMRRRIKDERTLGVIENEQATLAKAEQAERLAESTALLANLFTATFIGAVASILVQLAGVATNPLVAPTAAAAALTALQAAIVAADQIMPKEAVRTADELAVASEMPRPFAERAAVHAERARQILLAMRRAARLQDLSDRHLILRQLDLGADPAASPAARAASSLRTSAALLDSAHRLAATLGSLQPAIHRLTLPLAPVDVAPHRAALASGIDDLVRDKPAAEAREQIENLFSQARRRYASDPAILAQVETLLHAEARARGVG